MSVFVHVGDAWLLMVGRRLCFTKDLNAVPFDKFEEGTPASEGARFLRWCHMVIGAYMRDLYSGEGNGTNRWAVDEALPQRDLPYGDDGKVRLPEEAGEMPPQTLREKLKVYLEVKWGKRTGCSLCSGRVTDDANQRSADGRSSTGTRSRRPSTTTWTLNGRHCSTLSSRRKVPLQCTPCTTRW